jgi:hypothetical protein
MAVCKSATPPAEENLPTASLVGRGQGAGAAQADDRIAHANGSVCSSTSR